MYLTVAEFDTVSFPQFTADVKKCNPLISESCIEDMWRDLVFPDRATEEMCIRDSQKKMDKLCADHPEEVCMTVECNGSKNYTFPKSWLKITAPRKKLSLIHI